jgi:hypothetical protein
MRCQIVSGPVRKEDTRRNHRQREQARDLLAVRAELLVA